MAFKNFSGILLDPDGEVCAGDRLRFTQQTITGQVLAGAVSYLDIAPDGSYSIDLQYGIILIDHYDSDSKKWRLQGAVTVNENTKAENLPDLLGESTPPTNEQIKRFEDLLAQAKEAAAAADIAAIAARAAALAAEDSEKAAAVSAAEAKEAAAKVAADLAQSIELALQVAKDALAAAESAKQAAVSASDAQDAAIATAKDATAAAASSASASKSAIAASDSAAAAAISAGQAGDAAASAGSAAAGVALNAQEAKEAASAAKNSQEIAEYNGGKAEAAKEQAMRSESAAKLSEIAAKGAQEIASESAKSAMEDALKAAISAEFVAGKADIIRDQVITVATSTTKAVQSAVAAEASARRAEAAAGSFFSSIIDAGDWSAAGGEYPTPETPDMSYIWRCIEAGAVGEVNFAANDFLLYSSVSQEFTKIGGGGAGGGDAGFIDSLPAPVAQWKNAAGASGVDVVSVLRKSGYSPADYAYCKYKIDKEAGAVRIIAKLGINGSANIGKAQTIALPTNCKNNSGSISYNALNVKPQSGGSEVVTPITLGFTGGSIDIYLSHSTPAYGTHFDIEIPVLWDGETMEMQQERSLTSYRVAPLKPDPAFEAVTVIAASVVDSSTLLYRYYDNSEIRLVGNVLCTADVDGKVAVQIALPTAFKFAHSNIFDYCGFFIDSANKMSGVVFLADAAAGILSLSGTSTAGKACTFYVNLAIPVVRK